MRTVCVAFVAVWVLSLTGVGIASATPVQSCQAAKLRIAGKGISHKLRCYANAKRKSIPVDPRCLARKQRRIDNAIDRVGTDCNGTPASIDPAMDTCLLNLLVGVPGAGRCPAESTRSVGDTAIEELECYAKEVTKPGTLAACRVKVDAHLASRIADAGFCFQSSVAVLTALLEVCGDSIQSTIIP